MFIGIEKVMEATTVPDWLTGINLHFKEEVFILVSVNESQINLRQKENKDARRKS